MADLSGTVSSGIVLPSLAFSGRQWPKPFGVLEPAGVLECVEDPTRPGVFHIPDRWDIVYQKSILREHARLYYPEVELIRLDRDKTIVDDLYNESAQRRYSHPIRIRAFVEHNPNQNVLTKYGIDQRRDVRIEISVVVLDDANLLDPSDVAYVGDIVRFGGDQFEVADQRKPTSGYWVNSNVPLYVVLFANYYRRQV